MNTMFHRDRSHVEEQAAGGGVLAEECLFWSPRIEGEASHVYSVVHFTSISLLETCYCSRGMIGK